MSAPDSERRIRQLRHDVDDVYDIVDATSKKAISIHTVQRRHGLRLDEIQQSLDMHTGRLDRLEAGQQRLDDRMGGLEDRMGGLETRMGGVESKLDEVIDLLKAR